MRIGKCANLSSGPETGALSQFSILFPIWVSRFQCGSFRIEDIKKKRAKAPKKVAG
jgi:hypothetical protein